VVSSLNALHNAFSRRKSTPPSPSLSLKSSHSTIPARSWKSSSTSTLPVPFYPTTFWKKYGSESIMDGGEVLERIKSSGAGEKVTAKFRGLGKGIGSGEKREKWTGYKWVLLLFVVLVSPFLGDLHPLSFAT